MDGLFRAFRLFNMGSRSSKEQPTEPPEEPIVSGVLDKPWRPFSRGSKVDLLKNLNTYKPPEGVSHLKILLYGPVGAGKSSFINSIQTAIRDRAANLAASNAMADTSKSFTAELETHRIHEVGGEGFFQFVFTDTMGLEPGPGGILPEDIKLVLEGHVKEGYKFKHDSALATSDHYYRKEPTMEDQFHLLVCVLSANCPEIDKTIVDRMSQIRKAARDLKVPEMAILTKIDLVSEEMEEDLKNVYKSKYLQKKMTELSESVGISLNHMFPVKNYSSGNTECVQDMDELLLTALDHMIVYGTDCIIKKLHK